MKKYLYILIIIFIFFCVCLFCKGYINLYDGFSIGGQDDNLCSEYCRPNLDKDYCSVLCNKVYDTVGNYMRFSTTNYNKNQCNTSIIKHTTCKSSDGVNTSIPINPIWCPSNCIPTPDYDETGDNNNGINISQNLILSSSGADFSCSGISPTPTPPSVMYNCCKTTNKCEETYGKGKHNIKSLCNNECKKCPIVPNEPSNKRSVWCKGSNEKLWTGCLMNNPNDISYTEVNIPSCGVGDCNICKIVKEGDGQHVKCSQDATIYMKSVKDDGEEIGACKYINDPDYGEPIDIPKTGDSISRDDFCDSSKCNYETNNSPIIENETNKNLEFKNNTHDTIYIGIIVNTSSAPMNPNTIAYIGSYLNTINLYTGITKKNNVYFYEIPTTKSLYFKIHPLNWESGNAVVLKNLSNIDDKFNYVGLTNLEWTFLGTNASMDISAVTGFNIDCDLSIYNASQCDGLKTTLQNPNKISCNLNNMKNNCKSSDKFSNCFAPGYGTNTITDEGMKLQTDILSDKNNNCGKDDCIKCSTGPDRCFDINVCNQSGKGQDHSNCYANNIRDRWGCYLWWNNPDNKMAIDWLNKFDDNCPIYGWTYDELVMYFSNYQTDKKNWEQTNVTCNNQNDRPLWPTKAEYNRKHPQDFCDDCDSYKNSQLYKCIKGLETNIENCKGLIRHNKNKVLTTCSNITNKTLLRFTINSVM